MLTIDYEKFNEIFEYVDTAIGSGLIYKKDILSGRRPIKSGTMAGCKAKNYWVVAVDKKQYKVHRIVWALHKKADFNLCIDHINGNGYDNRIENLREATSAQNRQNSITPANNTSGFIGVSFDKQSMKWKASIMANGRRKFLGSFESAEEGFAAYIGAKKELHVFSPVLRNPNRSSNDSNH